MICVNVNFPCDPLSLWERASSPLYKYDEILLSRLILDVNIVAVELIHELELVKSEFSIFRRG